MRTAEAQRAALYKILAASRAKTFAGVPRGFSFLEWMVLPVHRKMLALVETFPDLEEKINAHPGVRAAMQARFLAVLGMSPGAPFRCPWCGRETLQPHKWCR